MTAPQQGDLASAFGTPATALKGILAPKNKTVAVATPKAEGPGNDQSQEKEAGTEGQHGQQGPTAESGAGADGGDANVDGASQRAASSGPAARETTGPTVKQAAPAPRVIAPSAPKVVAPTVKPAPQTKKAPSKQAGRVQQGAVVRDSSTEDSFQISVYLLPEAKTVAGQIRATEGKTNAEIAFDAIDAVHSDLPGLLEQRRVSPRPENSLFPARRRKRNRRVPAGQGGAGRRVLWALQVTDEEAKILDGLVQTVGAESRSELISVAMEADLLPDLDDMD